MKETLAGLILAAFTFIVSTSAQDKPPEPDGYRMEDYRAPVPATLAGVRVLVTAEAEAIWRAKAGVFIDVMPRPPKPPSLPQGTVWRDKPRFNIPGSMLLMSRNGVRRLLSTDRLVRRARRGLRAAVRRGETFHLWFHPCNFTDRLELMDEQFIVLERILAEAAALRQAGRLDILTMNQQADRLAARESRATAQPESVAFHDERAGLLHLATIWNRSAGEGRKQRARKSNGAAVRLRAKRASSTRIAPVPSVQ